MAYDNPSPRKKLFSSLLVPENLLLAFLEMELHFGNGSTVLEKRGHLKIMIDFPRTRHVPENLLLAFLEMELHFGNGSTLLEKLMRGSQSS
jgi:hypothetical protein